MNFTKDNLLLLRHGLDIMVRAEAGGVSQGGLDALSKDGAAPTIGARLVMAVQLGKMLDVEYARMVEEEKAAAAVADAAQAEKQE